MKQRLALLCILSVTMLYSCKHVDESEKALTTPKVNIDLDSIKKRGYITALVDNNSISYFLYKGQSMGYDYELLQRMAKDLGVKLRLRRISGVENAIKKLNAGEADVLAFPLTITSQRKDYVRFTQPHFNTHQVLVQRKPQGWERLTRDEINAGMIKNPHDLIGKTVHVLNRSSFVDRLRNLSEELGGEIIVVEDSADAQSESLIQKVAMGEIDYTVADQVIASVNLNYYPNLDASTVLSLPQQIAWAVRKNSPQLQSSINTWLTKIKKEATFMVIYNRYYKSPRTSFLRANSRYATINGDRLSPYDPIIKEGAEIVGWDWRLLAAMIYQESRFNPNDQSWAGARGLMQLMPATAQRFGVSNPDDPRQSIRAGVRFLKNLDEYWVKKVADSTQRIKFVMASYNVGLTHITDARKLTIKNQENAGDWGTVEKYLLKKSDPSFYKDPVVIAGYCKCEEPVRYVEEVMSRYEEYKLHIN
jgi:membrane-bound lytic murein transglycosylase F